MDSNILVTMTLAANWQAIHLSGLCDDAGICTATPALEDFPPVITSFISKIEFWAILGYTGKAPVRI
jgi:hypothetical protein